MLNVFVLSSYLNPVVVIWIIYPPWDVHAPRIRIYKEKMRWYALTTLIWSQILECFATLNARDT